MMNYCSGAVQYKTIISLYSKAPMVSILMKVHYFVGSATVGASMFSDLKLLNP